MRTISRDDMLKVVGCEIELRPEGPTLADLAPRVQGIHRAADVLRVEFPADAIRDVEAFALAEKVCCGGIDWDVRADANVILTIRASRPALDVIEAALRAS